MFDGAAAAVDTVVMDDPDAPGAPAIGRATTVDEIADAEELTMQILVLGEWHRRTPDLKETACGVPVRMVETPMRPEVLSERATATSPAGRMCRECFTPHELKRACANDNEAIKAEDEAAQKWLDEAPQRAQAREARREERARRNTNRGDR